MFLFLNAHLPLLLLLLLQLEEPLKAIVSLLLHRAEILDRALLLGLEDQLIPQFLLLHE
jgi:hypothetical protein